MTGHDWVGFGASRGEAGAEGIEALMQETGWYVDVDSDDSGCACGAVAGG